MSYAVERGKAPKRCGETDLLALKANETAVRVQESYMNYMGTFTGQ